MSSALFDGTLTLHQPARGAGYRVNVDALLLAWFAGQDDRRARRAADLGAGVGAVGLSLLYRDRAEHVTFFEVVPALSVLSQRNLAANGWAPRGLVVTVDLGAAEPPAHGAFDLVTCNPPYVEAGRGRPRRVAPEAGMGPLEVFTAAARRLLGRRGRACFVYPARELATLLATLRSSGLEPKRLCLVHSAAAGAARVALVEAVAGKPGGLVVQAPLVERHDGEPSLELLRILARR